MADRRERENARSSADLRRSGDDDVAHELDALAERYIAADDTEGPDLYACG